VKVLSVVGARPQFVKLAPVAEALRTAGADHVIVHTGQHYDALMSDVFFADLAIPQPEVHLGIGSGSHGAQTGAMLAALDPVLDLHRPDWVLVYGDTNSTLAAAVAAVKLHLPVAHLEAGLRSFNRRMPEEHNRVLTDHAADLCLAPTEAALKQLVMEGLGPRAALVGDVMTDICFQVRDRVASERPQLPGGVGGEYVVATIHRPDNTDEPRRLEAIAAALARIPVPVVLLAHPRLVKRAGSAAIRLARANVIVTEPLPYPQMVATVRDAVGVVTDSGGLQKEAFLLATPCTTLRTETEWPETFADGWNELCSDLDALPTLAVRPRPSTAPVPAFGTGDAAARVAEILTRYAAARSTGATSTV
jgi:UDP-N-acetylglucosamine 2-epimerase (non-hydrolysing)